MNWEVVSWRTPGLPTAQIGMEEMWMGLWKWVECACHHDAAAAAAAWVSWPLVMSMCGQVGVVREGGHLCIHQSGKTCSSFRGSHEMKTVM